MPVICDFHVHIYPCYDLKIFFEKVFNQISAPNIYSLTACMVLSETANCNYYSEIKQGIHSSQLSEFKVEDLGDCLRITNAKKDLYLFPGFQFNTLEKIEMLGLFSEKRVNSGLSILDSLELLKKDSTLAVINWAPGKWWGNRGKLIQSLINGSLTTVFTLCDTLCDTSLRPKFYLQPFLMAQALRRNWRVIYGSDPLPFPEEITMPFSYYSYFEADFDALRPRESMLEILRSQNPVARGRRNSYLKLLCRLWKLKNC